MNPTESTSVAGGKPIASTIFPPAGGARPSTGNNGNSDEEVVISPPAAAIRRGYGLPCAKCRTYYAANLAACPVCKSPERVSPVFGSLPSLGPEVEQTPDDAVLEEERERFLQEFKSHVQAGEMQINASESFHCNREENHRGGFEPAEVCQGCYEHERERADLAEAALLIDVKEAAQLVYDAVWSDPSDPTKTYQNAARALLGELRRRAGISVVLGSLKTLPD
jgi:hypothetical protein